MRAVIREKLMVPLLVVAALVGISLTVSGYWATWQSQKASSNVMPQALVTLPERRPLAEFILVDDAKGVFDLKIAGITLVVYFLWLHVLPRYMSHHALRPF